ncbi:DNA-processing protein DprA [Mycolicibacterium vanbaalenii]|uniref:DNA protecting protein DprA n=1 Tax=Mycolicibacterium vanbaalenii (strain DSM 7251 / JCM 13017 / BCRC 16820 / KCTC 9966 / NRRL B-24157 / PYR-1) TaxID=350058 RepID=A1T768_MYCVP|nr:DNA-processing protein DprA [Mycolicibacterium vanbaalenii]ABM13018.1 DNA protecting protein DprA [Mycolicibacterium vanbaalenii PYR-1]MCV7127971.1 DNA-protecting protein DprA [Mycolicibacterium vanbaalenii PYR-1]
MDETTRRAWAYLSRVAEPPCAALAALVAEAGAVDAAERVRRGAVSADLRARVESRRDIDCAAADLDLIDRRGGRLITPDDDDWPTWVLNDFGRKDPPVAEDYPPLVLWVLGQENLADVAARAAAIVGTRACTAYGEHVTADLVAGLVERDVAVVSGGAFGIDGAAHRAALASDGVTVAVLAGGIDVPYPAGHSALLHRVSGSGLLVSEYPPGVRPARYRFLTRNRLVAALSGATVVVEAGLRSGAANTAGWSRSLGRGVCAVPGPVTSAASAGCHELLRREGTVLVTRAQEVVEVMGRIGELADELEHPVRPLDGLSGVQRLVYEALPARGARTVDEIGRDSGVPAAQVLGPLTILEIDGLVERHEGKWRLARPARRAG